MSTDVDDLRQTATSAARQSRRDRTDAADAAPLIEPDTPAKEVLTPVGWWHRCTFEIARAFAYLLLRGLGLRGLYRFGAGFATLEWLINYRRRGRFAAQMREMFGGSMSRASRRRACRRMFVNSRCDKLFYLIFDRIPRPRLEQCFAYDGVERVDAVLTSGSGLYVALSHFGAHHVAALLMALRGFKVAGVRGAEEGPIRRYIQEKYARAYPEFGRMRAFYSHTFPREIYRAFQDGYLVGSALDVARVKDARLRTVDVTFFGERRPFLVGPLQIALRCGVPIFQGFVVSEPFFRYRLIAQGPLIDPAGEAETPEQLAQVMQIYADNAEAMLRKHPCHVSRV